MCIQRTDYMKINKYLLSVNNNLFKAIAIKARALINKNRIIYLISGDADFFQLGRENLFFINYKTKKAITLSKDEAKEALKF